MRGEPIELPADHPLAQAFKAIVEAQALSPKEFQAVVSAQLLGQRLVNWIQCVCTPDRTPPKAAS